MIAKASARALFFLLASAGALGCSQTSVPPTQRVAAWGVSVATPTPEEVAAQAVIARDNNSLTLAAISPIGARIGVDYRYEMPHCGVRSPIDIDGSFWDPTGIDPNSVAFDGRLGTFRLVGADEAIFTSQRGDILHFFRHVGPKRFGLCG